MSNHVIVAVLPWQKCGIWHDKVIRAGIRAMDSKLNNALSFNEYVEADGNLPTCEQETEELGKEVNDNKENAEAVYKPTPTFTNYLWKDTVSAVLIFQRPWDKWGVCSGLVVKALRYKPAGRGFDSRW